MAVGRRSPSFSLSHSGWSCPVAVPVRFFVHVLPLSAAPNWLGWPLAAPAPHVEAVDSLAVPGAAALQVVGGWYTWRLLSTNNRELARSAFRFAAPDLCRQAVREVQADVSRLALRTFAHPTTGQFGWCAESAGVPVAVGRRYEHEQNARVAATRFLGVVAAAEVADTVRALRDRRGPASVRYIGEGMP